MGRPHGAAVPAPAASSPASSAASTVARHDDAAVTSDGAIAKSIGKSVPAVNTDLYQVSRVGTVNVVDLTLPHTLDIQEFDRLNESILGLVRGELEGSWVLDLSRLSYMGSAALGLMVNLRQQIKQSGGRLVLCGLSPELMNVFKTCCMERLFKIVKGRAEAVPAAE